MDEGLSAWVSRAVYTPRPNAKSKIMAWDLWFLPQTPTIS